MSLSTTICENAKLLAKEAQSKYDERKALTKYAKEIETELADNEISVRPVDHFQYGNVFGEQKLIKKKKPLMGEKSAKTLILEMFENNLEKIITSTEINKYFSTLGRSAPAPTISLMVKSNLIESVNRGSYKLKPKIS